MTALEDELAGATPERDTYLSIGVFDGVHLGHRHLLELLKGEAKRAGCANGVVTFCNHPRTVLTPGASISYLTSVEERLRLLDETGIEMVAPITFTLEVSRLKAREFVALLQRFLHMRGLVVGPDFALGNKREGTPEVLRALGKEMGFSLKVADEYQHGEVQVSSTSIRTALAQGDVTTAFHLLGRHFALTGEVVHGAGRGGSVLGYPTANVAFNAGLTLPKDGIYATWAYIGQRRYQAATSIGMRPTFDTGERTVEAFILDFQGDLYEKSMRLEFVQRLRDEVAFESTEALKRLIDADVEQTRLVLNAFT